MRVKDFLFISSKNLRVYRKRNLMLVMVMGILFGFIFAVNLLLDGIENSYANYADQMTDGKVVIMANSSQMALTGDASPQISREEMVRDIEKYGGVVIGDTEKYDRFGSVVLPEALVENAIEADIDAAPADAAPLLVSASYGAQLAGLSFPFQYRSAAEKLRDYEELRETLIGHTFINQFGAKYYVVGMAAGGFQTSNLSFRQLEWSNTNLLNTFLEQIAINSGVSIVVDNGRRETWQGEDDAGAVAAELGLGAELGTEAGTEVRAEVEFAAELELETEAGSEAGLEESVIAVFEDANSAYEYFRNGKAAFMNTTFPNTTYFASVVAGMSPEIIYFFKGINLIVGIASAVLGLVAIVIVVFTSIRLIDHDKQNIALYYSLGATTGQVRMVYLFYFLELMLGALLFAFGLATIVVMLFSVLNQELLSVQAAVSFSLADAPRVAWYGLNWNIAITALVMLLTSLLCVAVNGKGMAQVHKKMVE